MKFLPIALATLCLGVQQANSFFFNLGSFLQPILNPKGDIYGEARIHNDRYGFEHIMNFDSRDNIAKQRVQSSGGHHQPEAVTSESTSKNQPLPQQNKKKNLRRNNNDVVATDLYKALGIPEDVIYTKVLPVHMAARRDLNRYFYKFAISSRILYESLKNLKELIEWITETYLKNINNLVLGNNNDIQGNNIYVNGQNQKVEGTENFVFNPKFNNIAVKGDNIVRIGRFDVDLDKIDMVRKDPYKAVTLLQIQEQSY